MTHPMFDPDRRRLRVEEWPAHDQAAWKAANAPFDPLRPTVGPASHWAPSTRDLVEGGYGSWLGWIQRLGELDPTSRPGERVTPDRLQAYLARLQAMRYAPYTISGRIQQLADAIRVMEPQGDWSWLQRAAGRLHQRAKPVKDVMGRLRSPEEILKLGTDLMEEADHGRFRSDFDRAVLHRDGLTLATLVYRPLRIMNLAGIIIGKNLRRCGSGWELAFAPEETKTLRPFEAFWPEELEAHLERYIAVHREVLLEREAGTPATEALWVAKGGAAMASHVLRYRVIKRTLEEFGTAINPHAFRHLAATTKATLDPEDITGVASLLGHATLETSEKHYNKARMVDAGARYHQAIRQHRKGRGARAPNPDQLSLGGLDPLPLGGVDVVTAQ
jgi:hypothetical protein